VQPITERPRKTNIFVLYGNYMTPDRTFSCFEVDGRKRIVYAVRLVRRSYEILTHSGHWSQLLKCCLVKTEGNAMPKRKCRLSYFLRYLFLL